MSSYDPPLQPEPSPYHTAPPPKKEFGEGMGGGLIAIAVIGGIAILVALFFIFPEFYIWLIALGFLAIAVIMILVVIFGFLVMVGGAALGLFHLFKRTQVQGPEVAYTLDMVEETKRGNQ